MGHWALLAINAYEDTVFYLDSLRTTSKATIRYVTDTAIAIFHSQKNINKSRKQTLWRTIDTRKSYSQAELDEVRVKSEEEKHKEAYPSGATSRRLVRRVGNRLMRIAMSQRRGSDGNNIGVEGSKKREIVGGVC
uniref:Ubiquitin-like protease family profile domain-containing protein n=1 Tax=Cucumis melo TaxID=3656 RepID=A0A9I9EBR8_CUCME